jgi:hypothetical protein
MQDVSEVWWAMTKDYVRQTRAHVYLVHFTDSISRALKTITDKSQARARSLPQTPPSSDYPFVNLLLPMSISSARASAS